MLQHTAECALAVTFLQLRKGASESKSPEVRLCALPWLLHSGTAQCIGPANVMGCSGQLSSRADGKVCCWMKAYEHLRRSLLPVLHQFEGLDEGADQANARDWSSLQMLARRTKNQLVLD